MKTIKQILCILFAIALLFNGAIIAQNADKEKKHLLCKASDKSLPKYRIGQWVQTLRTDITVIRISIAPKYFNEREIRRLAERLKQEFCNEQKLHIALFDNYKAAKNGLRVYAYLTKQGITEELRGFYDLDRELGTETIFFNSKRNNPLDEIKINLVTKDAEKK
jgi:hypothetical protein